MWKVAVALFVVSGLAHADSARVAVSAGGKCSVALPVDWSATGAVAQSKDKKVSVAVSQPKAAASFGDLKATLKKSLKDAKVIKDSDAELELEGKAVDGKPNVYRAIVVATGVFCAAEARYDGSVDVARTVVHSLAAAR
ncbi:MAG TPA: hypothetical protein VLT45_17395 [Kofleriaceae bacterium]|nr:hypothetical protein [Kofleriaceae bacterium]